jgi:hypothetical protein
MNLPALTYKLSTSSILYIFVLVSISLAGYAQDKSGNKLNESFIWSEVSTNQARQDIEQGKAKLLLVGGIASIHYEGQEVFEKKYKVSYYDYGCTPPDEKYVKEYNKAIFAYLDKQYGRKWRKQVRKDVIGYK